MDCGYNRTRVARLGGTGTVEMQAAIRGGVAIAKELVEVMDKAGLNAYTRRRSFQHGVKRV